jgi:hypothetical protein
MDLEPYKKTIEQLKGGGFSEEGKANLACWLGERAHLLVAEVERLRRGVQSMLDSPPLLVEIAHELLAESAHP